MATVSITVTAVNDAPVAVDDSAEAVEDTAKSFSQADLKGNDTDIDNSNAQLIVIGVSNPTNGTVAMNLDGSITFSPAANFNGAGAGFDYTLGDGNLTDAGHVAITVTAVNDAPVADGQSVTTGEDTAKAITLSGSDVEGSSLVFTVDTNPAHGMLTGTAPNLTYTPDSNYHGPDSFTFTVNDGSLDSSAATVSITVDSVNDVPVASNGNATVDEDSTENPIALNASDADGDTLTYTVLSGPSHGTLLGSGASRTYTPATNYNGPDSLTFMVNDGTVDSNTATVSITVNAVNDAPIAEDDSTSVAEDSTSNPIALTASDVDGDTIEFEIENGPTYGILAGTGATLNYTPDADYFGPDSFTFKVNDGTADSNVATFSITVTNVNDDPVATDDTATVDEDSPATTIDILANDNDGVDTGETLTVVTGSVTDPAHGVATLISTGDDAGKISYTPDADYFGADSFDYTISDGNGGTATATVFITVSPINDAPVALDDQDETDEDTAVDIAVLDNDTDVEGNTLSVMAVTQGGNGAVAFTDGLVSYTPAENFNGTDSFTYTVSDGNGDSDTATVDVSINAVNDAPVAVTDNKGTAEDTALLLNQNELTGNDSTGPDNESDQSLTVTAVGSAVNGTVELITSGIDAGKIRFTPNADFNGEATFTYTVTDNGVTAGADDHKSDVGTVNVEVSEVNDSPDALDDAASVGEDSSVIVAVLTNDLAGPSNEASQTLTVTGVTQGADGTVVVNANGSITYTPDADFNGADSFTYTVTDNGTTNGVAAPLTDTATVSITVNAINDAPIASDDSATVAEDGSVTVSQAALIANDVAGPANESSQTLTVTVVEIAAGAHGTVTLNGDGSVTYAPNADYFGPDSFMYTVEDDGESFGEDDPKTGTATVSVTVTAVNDAPSFTPGADESVNEDAGAQSIANWAENISAGPANENGQTVTFLVNNDNNSLFSVQPAIAEDGTLSYTPAPNANGAATVEIALQDNGGIENGGIDTSATQTFLISVVAVNDAPSFAKGANETAAEDSGAQTGNGWATDISAGPADEIGQTVSFAVTNDNSDLFSVQPAIDSTGTLTYTPASDANGIANVTVTLQDDGGTGFGGSDTSAPQTFTVTVTEANDAPTAQGDNYGTDEDTPLVFEATELLGNDSTGPGNESGQSLSVTAVAATMGTHGTVDVDNGAITYTPDSDFNGPASFTYTVTDDGTTNGVADPLTATGTVSLTVNAVNDVPSFTKGADQTVLEDAGLQTVTTWATDISPRTDPCGEPARILPLSRVKVLIWRGRAPAQPVGRGPDPPGGSKGRDSTAAVESVLYRAYAALSSRNDRRRRVRHLSPRAVARERPVPARRGDGPECGDARARGTGGEGAVISRLRADAPRARPRRRRHQRRRRQPRRRSRSPQCARTCTCSSRSRCARPPTRSRSSAARSARPAASSAWATTTSPATRSRSSPASTSTPARSAPSRATS